MISSARLRKSENALNHARPYMEQLQNILDHIASEINDYQSPLSQDRPVQRVAIVIFAANEGLCGAFNLLLYKKLLETLKEYDGKVKSPVFVYPVGRKLVNDIKRTRGVEVMPIPDLFEKKQYAEGATALADELIHRFLEKDVDRVEVIYAHYKSMGTQIISREQLLPWVPQETKRYWRRFIRWLSIPRCIGTYWKIRLQNRPLASCLCKWQMIMLLSC